MITELLYSNILKMNRGSLHTRNFMRIHLSVFRYRLAKIDFATPETFRRFKETGRCPVRIRPNFSWRWIRKDHHTIDTIHLNDGYEKAWKNSLTSSPILMVKTVGPAYVFIRSDYRTNVVKQDLISNRDLPLQLYWSTTIWLGSYQACVPNFAIRNIFNI